MPELVSFFRNSFWLVIAGVASSVFILWLIVNGGKNYSTEDAEAHAQEFAGLVKEGHGKMTGFLWVSFIAIIIWSIYYFALHIQEFAVIFNQG